MKEEGRTEEMKKKERKSSQKGNRALGAWERNDLKKSEEEKTLTCAGEGEGERWVWNARGPRLSGNCSGTQMRALE
jgi:hypothetical protein